MRGFGNGVEILVTGLKLRGEHGVIIVRCAGLNLRGSPILMRAITSSPKMMRARAQKGQHVEVLAPKDKQVAALAENGQHFQALAQNGERV
jgi:hypothetical protein